MPLSDYDYLLLFSTEEGVALSHASIEVDWQPAIEWARFTALREAARTQTENARVGVRIEPEWHPSLGEPYIKGVRVSVPEGRSSVRLSNSFFARYAQAGSVGLVQQKKLAEGERYRYFVLAIPRMEKPGPFGRIRFRAAVPELPQASDARLTDFLSQAVPAGVHHAGDMPVFVPCQVLDEVTEIYRQQIDTETGGVLVGRLRRDRSDGQVFLEVTAQIPAQHTDADRTRLTFTADTWKAVRAALAIRKRDELWIGWWHTHPVRSWMATDNEETAEDNTRSLSGRFFSTHDAAVHRTAFVSAYCVALVVSDLGPGRETYSLFGWREGVIASRGYHIIEGAAHDRHAAETAAETALATCDATALPGFSATAGGLARRSLVRIDERGIGHEQ